MGTLKAKLMRITESSGSKKLEAVCYLALQRSRIGPACAWAHP